MLKFPARTFVQFFKNHGLFSQNTLLQWYTVEGGSREYVRRLTDQLDDAELLDRKVHSVERLENGVEVTDVSGQRRLFDQVVIATHADQALDVLSNPSVQEQSLLRAFRYQRNHVILHRDVRFMPANRKAWSSWVYRASVADNDRPEISLTYWMNNLQPLKTETPVLVTLNPTEMPRTELIYDSWETEHPLFDESAIHAQQQIHQIQGVDRIWYCGAYQRYGFHEDGLVSAISVAEKLGVQPPWKNPRVETYRQAA